MEDGKEGRGTTKGFIRRGLGFHEEMIGRTAMGWG
jgi:hypothetical protein